MKKLRYGQDSVILSLTRSQADLDLCYNDV